MDAREAEAVNQDTFLNMLLTQAGKSMLVQRKY